MMESQYMSVLNYPQVVYDHTNSMAVLYCCVRMLLYVLFHNYEVDWS